MILAVRFTAAEKRTIRFSRDLAVSSSPQTLSNPLNPVEGRDAR